MEFERLAVRSFDEFWDALPTLKRDALLFDRIGVTDLGSNLAWLEDYPPEPDGAVQIAELEYLMQQNVLFTPTTDIQRPEFAQTAVYRDYLAAKDGLIGVLERSIVSWPDKGSEPTTIVQFSVGQGLNLEEVNCRINAALLELDQHVLAYPLLSRPLQDISIRRSNSATRREVIEIIMHDMPIPDDGVSWEKILDVRSDATLREQRHRLMQWIETVGQSNRTYTQIAEEYRDIAADRKEYFKKQNIEFLDGVFSTLVIAGVELATTHEFPWGAVATALFELRKTTKSLMESEDKAPGSAIAFVDSMQKEFNR